MNRIPKYRASLSNFLEKRSCLAQQNIGEIKENTKKTDYVFPMLFLTIMNNQNKKNHVSTQGYNVAIAIALLDLLIITVQCNPKIIIQPCDVPLIIHFSNLCIASNISSIKGSYSNQSKNFMDITVDIWDTYNKLVGDILIPSNIIEFTYTGRKCPTDVIKWYIKDDKDLKEKFESLNQLTKTCLDQYVHTRYSSLCKCSIQMGYIIGGTKSMKKGNCGRIARYFSFMYKISKDFENIIDDIKLSSQFTTNYVLNFGLQETYDTFLVNKHKFMEEIIIDDMYTNTIKEMIDEIESRVDQIIDTTSPDLATQS